MVSKHQSIEFAREGLKKKMEKLGLLAEVRAGGRLRGGSRAQPCYQVTFYWFEMI